MNICIPEGWWSWREGLVGEARAGIDEESGRIQGTRRASRGATEKGVSQTNGCRCFLRSGSWSLRQILVKPAFFPEFRRSVPFRRV